MSRLAIESLNISAFPPHQQFLNALDVEITSAKLISLEAIDLTLIPPVAIDLGLLVVDIVNEKYIHLNEIIFDIEAQQNVSLNEIIFDLRHPTTVFLSAIDIDHKMLSNVDLTSLTLSHELLPTRVRYWRTLIETTRLPKMAVSALDVAMAFPHKVVLLGVPLVTHWAKWLTTEVSGAVETDMTGYRMNITSLYSSALLYYGTNNNLNRFKVKIEAGAGKAHTLKTDIYLDFDSWFTRYGGYIDTNIETASTLTHACANHLMVHSSSVQRMNVTFSGRRGLLYTDIGSDQMQPFINLGASNVWVTQQAWLGYTVLLKQVKYGIFVRVPNNVATFPVLQSFLGIPFTTGYNLRDLNVIVNLLRTEEIDFDVYANPNELLTVYGIVYGVNGSLLANSSFGWIDITELTKRHLALYSGGDMILQIVPDDSLIHQDLIEQRPFLFRMFNIDLEKNFHYKLFRKET